jgi:hypothetical protein
MYGWINNIIENLILSRHFKGLGGDEIWQQVKVAAGCENIADGSWIFSRSYPDDLTFKLIEAATLILNISEEDFVEQIGSYIVIFSR